MLRWDGGRESPMTWGKRVAFRVAETEGEGVRRCTGARGHPCPARAPVPGRSTGGRCEECARLERAHSVAADTIADDPRPYHVYLAWFGPGLLKVGITAVERGSARLLEQGAVCFTWLGTGPLMATRRTEELLRAALGVPDRIPYAHKRAIRTALPGTEAERAAEVAELYGRAVALSGWPESLTAEPLRPVDHVRVFGLDRLTGGSTDRPTDGSTGEATGEAAGGSTVRAAARAVTELVPGGTVGGALLAAAGPDLHLATVRGEVVLDTRLMTGWTLSGAADDPDEVTVPLSGPMVRGGAAVTQEGLF